MNWRNLLNQADPFIGAALTHRREHPGVYAVAHALAADYHRASRHPWRARWHRMWRRRYERIARGTEQHQECALMMRRHDEG